MVKDLEMITIELDPTSDSAKVLDAAGTTPVTVISHGQRFMVRRQPDERSEEEKRAAFRAALEAAAGVFTPEEGEQLKQNSYRWREEGTRPLPRP